MHAFLPSPAEGVWYLGPLPIRAYALSIIIGIALAIVITDRRWRERGGLPGQVLDIAIWAVPFGIVGARLYHVATDWPVYFGPGGKGFWSALEIWQGGLGSWGGVTGGAIGAWIACRRRGLLLPPLLDAVAPSLGVATVFVRLGNYFNQELFGSPSDLPWALEIALENRPTGFEQFATFHPTFLYEALWAVLIAAVVWWADRRWLLGHGRAFALYVALYCVGRLGMELLRIDTASQVLGLRVNVFTSILVGLAAIVYMVVSARLRPGREPVVRRSVEVEGGVGSGPDRTPPAEDSGVDAIPSTKGDWRNRSR